MQVAPTEIPDVLIIEPDVYRDQRGFFLETYHAERYRAAGIAAPFVQDNHSRSVRGTLRGLHGQRRNPQGKLVRAVVGEVFDVAVDVRSGSPSYGRWVGVTLTADSCRQLYVPPGFLHGFCVVSEVAEIEYKCTAPYDAADEIGVVWDDPTIAVAWPVDAPLLSARDAALPRLGALR
ncbi:MAG: dTDP-4-dehydrorhamnose 3,5-epimerase [Candidatus Binatia bacterium]